MCDVAAEGAGPVPGPAVPEGSHEGPHEAADRDGPSRGSETPQTEEGQMCHHLAKLRTHPVQRYSKAPTVDYLRKSLGNY